MDSRLPPQPVDPAFLPPGTRVGPWRVRGWGGRGAYGTVYRVVREGDEAAGSFALKLAHCSRDERYAREVELLSRIHHPHIPRLIDHGVWHHRSGEFPYLVMEWIEGTPLYDWAERHNPSSSRMARVLAALARALEATHAAAAVHRDLKGDNVLVRLEDGHPFLTDFGAGAFRGAATLTSRLLPPGTPAYRSPEAWGFVRMFSRHPTIHYPASACDDLFALGVTAYRLVTGVYPPSTHPQEQVARSGGDVSRSSEQDAPMKEELQRRACEVKPSAATALVRARSAVVASNRGRRGALAAGVLLLAAVAGVSPHGSQEVARARDKDPRESDSVAVGDTGMNSPVATLSSESTDAHPAAVGHSMPEEPFPGQRKPPCTKHGEVVIRGGCWYELGHAPPPCGEDAYEWQGACYLPSYPPRRRPAADPP